MLGLLLSLSSLAQKPVSYATVEIVETIIIALVIYFTNFPRLLVD